LRGLRLKTIIDSYICGFPMPQIMADKDKTDLLVLCLSEDGGEESAGKKYY